MKEIMLDTLCGKIKGVKSEEGIQQFRGIRYAHADRWEYPEEVKQWEGIYDATCFQAACVQTRTYRKETDDSFYYKEFRKDETYTYSEDCFYLNIWKPAECQDAPVIFYIHGGAFMGGCGNEKHFDGTKYAQRGIIFITCNYRLGPFGFCCLPELAEIDGHTGNYGLFDQLTAFQWIRHNIRQFGGDPECVTLMGQSAGAMSVMQLCSSPLAKDHISKAIMTSGGGVSDAFGTYLPAEEAYPFWKDVTGHLGKDLEEWKKADPKALLEVMFQEAGKYENAIQYFSPVVDGKIICHDAGSVMRDKVQAKIPYLTGSTKDDMAPEIIGRMAKEWAVLQSRQDMVPSYCFYFCRNLPGDAEGAWHSSELWYTIGALERCWRPMEEWDYRLSDTMISYFSNFAAFGDPNGENLPEWKPTADETDKVMCFGDTEIAMK